MLGMVSSLMAAQNGVTESNIESAELLNQEFQKTATSVDLWIKFRNALSATTGNERKELEKLITEIQSGSKISNYTIFSDMQIKSFKVLLSSKADKLSNHSLSLHVACFTNPIRYKSIASAFQNSTNGSTAEGRNTLPELVKLRSNLLTEISKNLKDKNADQLKIYRKLNKIDMIDKKIAESSNQKK